jgi:Zn-dependent protease with chaperone function
MPFLLMVFLTLVCLPDGCNWPEPFRVPSAAASAWLTAAGVLAVTAYAWRLARRARRALESDPFVREAALARYERGQATHRVFVFAAYGFSLVVFGWGRAAYWLWGAGGEPWPGVAGIPWSGAELVLLAPFLASLVLSWFCFYDADRAARRSARRIFGIDPSSREWLDRHAAPFDPPAPAGGRLAYILFQLRQKLALVLIPLSLLLAMKEVRRHFRESSAGWELAVNAVGIAVVFVGMPWLVRVALGLRSMPAGPLKDRLLATARRLGFRFSDILLWHTRGGMANAMVIGLFPWPRYVVFTDRLIEDFTPDEVQAVFGHEVGHVKHRHIPYYLGFLSGSLLLLWLAGERLKPLWERLPVLGYWIDAPVQQSHELLAMLPPTGLMLAYIFVVFGFLSRRCERQADVFGCRAVSCQRGDCPGHDRDEALAASGRGLCPTGIRTFVRALERVAAVNGISRDRPGFLQSWQHSTIARRVDFLQRVEADPAVERRFQRRVGLVKWGLFAVLGVLIALVLRYGKAPPEPDPDKAAAPGLVQAPGGAPAYP